MAAPTEPRSEPVAPRHPAVSPVLVRDVLLPWLLSRALVIACAVHVARQGAASSTWQALSRWDGDWYLDIARLGYAAAWAGPQEPHPFFPLLPGVLRALAALGLPARPAGVVLDHLALLGGLATVHELVRGRFGCPAAAAACWAMALFPGSAPFSFVYPEALLLVFAAGAFLEADRGHPRRAGLLAGLAALTRPNGFAVALALGAGQVLDRRSPREVLRVLLPAVLALGAWMGELWRITGDPLAWIHAKAGWDEVTLAGIAAGRNLPPKIDLAAAAVGLAAVAAAGRAQPRSWRIFTLLWVLPPFATGLLGMPRYVSVCFPVFAEIGRRLSTAPRPLRVATWLASAGGLAFLALRMSGREMMP